MKKIAIILMSLLLLVGCNSKKEEVGKLDKLTTTYVTSPLNVPSIVEKHEGIFAKNLPDTSVEYVEITSGAEQSQALASGDVELLHAIGGSSVVASAAAGADIKIINMYSRAPEAFAMFTKSNDIKSPSDLVGKTVAGPMGTNLHELLVAYLDKEKLSIGDVNFVNMSIPDALAGLEGGSIDVALLGGPASYKASQMGFNKITDGKGLIEAIICVASSQKFYDEHKDIVDKLIESQKEVRDIMKNDKDKVKEMVKEELGIDDNAFDTMFAQYDFDLEIKDSDIEGLQKTADFMFANKMIDKKVDAKELFIKK